MNRHKVPEAFVDWTQDMLRRLTVNHGGILLKEHPAGGCPQEGVLFPLLWCLVVDKLLSKLKKAGFLIYGYADDVAVVAKDNFLKILKKRIDIALRTIQNWCKDLVLS